MRTKNSLINAFVGVTGQIMNIILGFVLRMIFIWTLGIEYLSVSGLFANVLTILSLTNLGLDSAIIYSLYKPISDKDEEKIKAFMKFYAFSYRVIGLLIFVLGLCLLPFIQYLIRGNINIPSIKMIYLLFLLDSALSYFFIYKSSLMIANQKNYIVTLITHIATIVSNIALIALLFTAKNFILYLAAFTAFNLIKNIVIAKMADKMYPYLKDKCQGGLSEQDKKMLFKNISAIFVYRVSGVATKGMDNLIISAFVNIIYVGIYSNYLLITNALNALLQQLFSSITASVGNLNVTESNEKKYEVFQKLQFANFWIIGLCSIGLWVLVNPFITLWIGKGFVLEQQIVLVIILNFYLIGMQNTTITFRSAMGLFWDVRFRPLITAAISLIVSIGLSQILGVLGVFLGTAISTITTLLWYDPYIVHKHGLKMPLKNYFIRYLMYFMTTLIVGVLVSIICSLLRGVTIGTFVIKAILCILLTNVAFYLMFRKTSEYQYFWRILIDTTTGVYRRAGQLYSRKRTGDDDNATMDSK